MASHTLAIPMTTIAFEATFNAGTRVIDPYYSCLSLDTVQVIMYVRGWCRIMYNVKKKIKVSLAFILSSQINGFNCLLYCFSMSSFLIL